MNTFDLVQNINRLTEDDYAPTPEFMNQIHDHIGNVVTGDIRSIQNNPNMVVKIDSPCKRNQQLDMHRSNCLDMEKGQIIAYLPNGQKTLLQLANFLVDGTIGAILNTIQDETPHFIQTHGVYFSAFYKSSYTIQEKAQPTFVSQLITPAHVYLMLFQVAHGLTTAQNLLEFTHYNLHLDNLSYESTSDENLYYNYSDQGEVYTVEIYGAPFITKIHDFGLSRLTYHNLTINRKHDSHPDQGFFDPYFDFIMLLGSLMQRPIESFPIVNLAEIAQIVFNINPDGMTPERYLQLIYNNFYVNGRPNMERILELHPSTISTILHYLALKLHHLNVLSFMYQSTTEFISSIYREIPQMEQIILDEGIVYERGFYQSMRKQYSYSLPPNQENEFIYHQVSIYPAVAFKRGYRFKTICCKMDPIEYITDKIGVAMNGTYFDLLKTYQVFGRYRQYLESKNIYYETNQPLNQIYQKYYGWVVLNNGNISIEQVQSEARPGINISQIREGFMAGPILVWDGQIIFDESELETTVNIKGKQVKIFQCQPPGPLKHALIQSPDQLTYTYNCDQIYPSQLAHAGNPNPRTMLMTTRDNRIFFITVEGRRKESSGADLVDLARLAYQLGALSAINLDGGRSSTIAWNTLNDTQVYTTNRLTNYAVGNIVALVQE